MILDLQLKPKKKHRLYCRQCEKQILRILKVTNPICYRCTKDNYNVKRRFLRANS